MPLTPWYKIATPREDLRKRAPLDAAQFAVHLDQVVAGDAPPEYADADRFLARTFITEGLQRFAGEAVRRLAGERQGANAVLNLTTQFGGGKTHALTLLYHLTKLGPAASDLVGVRDLLDHARVDAVTEAATAVFVGTSWSAVSGRGGNGEPLRHTPWGEIAWQLAQQTGRPELFDAVRAEDEARVAPGEDVIARFLPADRPVLILMDETMAFVTKARAVKVGESTLSSQFYEFVRELTGFADGRDRLVVVISLPKSEEEMSAEDEQDFNRLAKATTRVAEPYLLARDLEIPEIVRRRLFDSVGTPDQIRDTARAYAKWVQEHRDQLPLWFPLDRAQETFEASYPFHPTLLSVFERKWQTLHSFQRTRGVLRLLAQWVADAYEDGFKGAHSDPLIALGTAPLDDQFFRASALDQLGEERLQAAILADIAGETSHASRLDAEAPETLRNLRLHQKVATALFFESSGGQQRQEATVPELRLAVGEPELDIGYVETALEALQDACYYLGWEGNRYRFSIRPNLNKLLADRRAALDTHDVEEEARAAIRKVFASKQGVESPFELCPFPDDTAAVSDLPALQLVYLDPTRGAGEETREFVRRALKEKGANARVFKNALIFALPDSSGALLEAARRSRAWKTLGDESYSLELDDEGRRQLAEQQKRAERDLQEGVWRAYHRLAFLGPNGDMMEEDLGLLHSSAAESMMALVQARLRQRDELTEALAPGKLLQNWPKGLEEWSTKAFRDAVYASPVFPRVTRADALKDTIARGVRDSLFGYAIKRGTEYVRIEFGEELDPADVDFSDDVVLVPQELAEQLKEAAPTVETPVPAPTPTPTVPTTTPGETTPEQTPIFTGKRVAAIRWKGSVPPQKWTTFYTKVLSRLVSDGGLELVNVEFEAAPSGGLHAERADEIVQSLRDLGLDETIDVEEASE
jgi:hypothetical protein